MATRRASPALPRLHLHISARGTAAHCGRGPALTSPLEYTNEPYAIAKIAGLKMCESFNLQYGTDYVAVMPTNLYGPNDNFHLENSHVLPAMIRKVHLARLLGEGDYAAVRADLRARPVSTIAPDASDAGIAAALASFGIMPAKCACGVRDAPARISLERGYGRRLRAYTPQR